MEAYCRSKGWEIVKIFKEAGASGRDDNRPAFQDMIYEATKTPRPVDVILTITTSRFSRDVRQARIYKHLLRKAGVSVVAIKQEVSDDPMGGVIEGIFELIDQYESEINALHTRRAMIENARQGNFNGSRPPFGFKVVEVAGNKKRLKLDESEAEIVKEIFDIYLGSTGQSLGVKGIASMLNARGDTFRGEPWKKGTVHTVLTREAYIGKLFFNKKDSKSRAMKPSHEWVEVTVPRIIEDEMFAAVQHRMGCRSFDNPEAKRRDNPTLLTGLLKCKCGAAMTLMSGKGGAYRYYRCTRRSNISNNSCDTPNFPVDELNGLVLRTLKHQIFRPERVRNILDELRKTLATAANTEVKQRKLVKELSDVKAQLSRLSVLFETEVLPLETLQERSVTLSAKQRTIQQQLDELACRSKLVPARVTPEALKSFCKSVRERFDEVETGFAKEYLKMFVEQIVVDGKKITITGNSADMASCLEKKSSLDGLTGGANNSRVHS